ncbi:MAG: D-alanine--D-alanine ligase [Clostridiales Family XIII bacterium]|nr:D-alanine--D-alanine ligase [Clostridiales Family XIII bacterium]
MANTKKRIGILFGGRSREHEISVLSAASVMDAIDRGRYDVLPVGITKEGAWRRIATDLSGLSTLEDARMEQLFAGSASMTIADFDAETDFAFPVMHGPFGEDGTIQGLFEMLGKPYAGCGVAASAISMDKIFTKEIWRRAGLPVCGHTHTTAASCREGFSEEVLRIEAEIAYPIFVKPANMGSSVGITKVFSRPELEAGISEALRHDRRVIFEQTVCGRELEVALLGNEQPAVSAVGEILVGSEYYDYDSKYRGGGTRLEIPAKLPAGVAEEIGKLAEKAYRALDGEGFSRVDLFFDEKQGKIYLSEMNAIPGFTQYSMFPLLWRAKGLAYEDLIERIIELGYERHHTAHHRQPAGRP